MASKAKRKFSAKSFLNSPDFTNWLKAVSELHDCKDKKKELARQKDCLERLNRLRMDNNRSFWLSDKPVVGTQADCSEMGCRDVNCKEYGGH